MTNHDSLLDFNAACLFLAIKASRLRSAVFKREIPHYKIGRLIRFNKNELEKWLEKNRVEIQAY